LAASSLPVQGIRYDERLELDMIAVPIRVQRFATAASPA
jgi:hypothetical protein